MKKLSWTSWRSIFVFFCIEKEVEKETGGILIYLTSSDYDLKDKVLHRVVQVNHILF